MRSQSQAMQSQGAQFAPGDRFSYHSTMLFQGQEDEASSRPDRSPAETEAAEGLLLLVSRSDPDKCFHNLAVQYPVKSAGILSANISSLEATYQSDGRRDSIALDSGYGSNESRRNSLSPQITANEPRSFSATRGRGEQSRKVQRQAERRDEKRKGDFAGLRPRTDGHHFNDYNRRYFVRRLKHTAALSKKKKICWESFQKDYNARFPGESRTLGSLKSEKTRLQNKGQFKLSYWQTRGEP